MAEPPPLLHISQGPVPGSSRLASYLSSGLWFRSCVCPLHLAGPGHVTIWQSHNWDATDDAGRVRVNLKHWGLHWPCQKDCAHTIPRNGKRCTIACDSVGTNPSYPEGLTKSNKSVRKSLLFTTNWHIWRTKEAGRQAPGARDEIPVAVGEPPLKKPFISKTESLKINRKLEKIQLIDASNFLSRSVAGQCWAVHPEERVPRTRHVGYTHDKPLGIPMGSAASFSLNKYIQMQAFKSCFDRLKHVETQGARCARGYKNTCLCLASPIAA